MKVKKNNVSAFHGNERTYAQQSRYKLVCEVDICLRTLISAVILKLMVQITPINFLEKGTSTFEIYR